MSKTKTPAPPAQTNNLIPPWQGKGMTLTRDECRLIELLREAGRTCESQREAWREMYAAQQTLEQFFRDEYRVQLQFDQN
jgi:hypothetical protein